MSQSTHHRCAERPLSSEDGIEELAILVDSSEALLIVTTHFDDVSTPGHALLPNALQQRPQTQRRSVQDHDELRKHGTSLEYHFE